MPFHTKTRVCAPNPVHDCSWKQFPASNWPQPPSNLIIWTISVTMKLFTQLQFKIRATNCEKVLNFVLLDNYFTDYFTGVQIRHRINFEFGPGRFFRKIKNIPAKIWLILTIGAVNKNIKSKREFCRQSWTLYF